MVDFTTVVGVDQRHMKELALTWPTWVKHRPEIVYQPLLLICDADGPQGWRDGLSAIEHPDMRIVDWSQPDVPQREKMLSAITDVPGREVRTSWYLKLDTDVAATRSGNWLDPRWFRANDQQQWPVFVASPWGYTKPANAINRLDDWADQIDELNNHPRLDLPYDNTADLIRHPRITSWCFFADTRWTAAMSELCGGKLPVPSQDTFLWYCAARRGDFFRKVRMKRFGWQHVSSLRRLRRASETALRTEFDLSALRPFLSDAYAKQLSDEGILAEEQANIRKQL